MADGVSIRVNGREFGGWKEARVTRGIESVAGSFELGTSDRWGESGEGWEIREEDECVVAIDGEPVITGYVDVRAPSFSAEDHSIAIKGRDKTGMLVDCSAKLDHYEFKDLPLVDLAGKLCEPFGIPVELDLEVFFTAKPPKKFSIDPGETAFEVLDRACRLAGVLPVADGAGGLRLTRTGSARAATELVEGENILSASAEFNAIARFRSYVVAAQHQGSNDWHGNPIAAVKGSATDEGVTRAARVLLIRPAGSATPESAKARAEWEAKVRAARADAVSVTVQGWRQGNGALWEPNQIARVRSPHIGIDGDMLITTVTASIGATGGTTTTLALKRPDAFTPEPVIKAAAANLWKKR